MRKEWQLHALGDVCKMGSGGTPLTSKREYYNGGTIPWLQSGEVAQGEVRTANNFITQAGFENSAARIFPQDTVLVAMYGATAGQVGILRFEASTNQAVCGIFPNERFHPKFLYYALLSKKNELISRAVGNAQPNISQVKIKNTYVPVPPLVEQKHIVAILDEAFEGIDAAVANAEKNLANACELFDSYLNSVFAHQGEGWVVKNLSELIDVQSGFAFKSQNYKSNGHFLVRIGNVQSGILSMDNPKYVVLDKSTLRFALCDGDILTSLTGNIGRVAVVEASHLPAALNQRVARLALKKTGVLDKAYLVQFLSSTSFRQSLSSVGHGAAQQNVSPAEIGKIKIPFPSFTEQKRIATALDARLEQTGQLQVIYQQKLKALAKLKQAILQKAFAGELTTQSAEAVQEAAE